MSSSSSSSVAISSTTRLLKRNTTIIVTGVGLGIVFIGYLIKRYWSKHDESEQDDADEQLLTRPYDAALARSMSRLRRTTTPSSNDRGSRHISLRSGNVPYAEYDLISSLDRIQELMRVLDRLLPSPEVLRTRSEKDRKRFELLGSVIDRLRIVEADMRTILSEGGLDKESLQNICGDETCLQLATRPCDAGVDAMWSGNTSHYGGTLSVLSDDSFVSAYEDLPVCLDDTDILDREAVKVEISKLGFYQSGLTAAMSGQVNTRKIRCDYCGCDSEADFKAKVWCIRQAFNSILSNEHNRLWLAQAGRQLIADLMRQSQKDPAKFYVAYDAMMQFLMNEQNKGIFEEELKQRRVADLSFWDVMLDFVLMDSFDDLARPPPAVYAVTKNMFLSHSMKDSTLTTVIWSMLKAKRSRLLHQNGFIAHFYNISEVISPTITLGFLGTDEHVRGLCQYFKEQTFSFVSDIFNINRVRYTELNELADDIWAILQSRIKTVQNRLTTEVVPVS